MLTWEGSHNKTEFKMILVWKQNPLRANAKLLWLGKKNRIVSMQWEYLAVQKDG